MNAAVWHDVECATYVADLDLWRDLADEHGDPVLDIGCGTGRVALDLAEHGHSVRGLDSDPDLTDALVQRARLRSLDATAQAGDARSFDPGRTYPLAIAPMQVVQLLGGSDGRRAFLSSTFAALEPGGVAAIALADPFEATGTDPEEVLPPLPDVLERDGWVFYSTPIAVRDEGDAVAIDRKRQAVSPAGELTEEAATIRLDTVSPETLEAEGREAGFTVLPARHVDPTRDYVGSIVVMLERQRGAQPGHAEERRPGGGRPSTTGPHPGEHRSAMS